MRNNNDRTTYDVKDLGDQPQGRYLLRFTSPSVYQQPGRTTVVWVDGVEVLGDAIQGWRTTANGTSQVVVSFSRDHTWVCLAAEDITTMTMQQMYEQTQTDIDQQTTAREQMEQAIRTSRGIRIVGPSQSTKPEPDEDGPMDFNWRDLEGPQ